MSKKLAIKGHATRGNEVIEILGMLCGKHPYMPYIGIAKCNIKTDCYYMCDYGFISWSYIGPEEIDKYKIFTLEEFLEKYPYKIGDKVVYEDDNDIVVISEIIWDDTVGDIFYNVKRIDEDDCFLCPPELLKPYKETNKELAIKGHPTRGNEVIEILEMMGGKNIHKYDVIRDDYVYFLSEKGSILAIPHCNIHLFDCVIFTLDEFLEKYPFKVGDKVTLDNKLCSIIWMCWECNKIYYYVQGTDHPMFQRKVEVNQLKPYKETNMNENKFPSFEPMFKMNDELEYKIPDGYEITEVSKDTVFIKPIKPQYPKTYKECCDVLLIPPYYNLRYHTYERGYNEYATSNTLLSLEDKLNTLGKVIICRDAYWKILGEEMGLGKPWDSTYGCGEWGYWIGYNINENKIYLQDSRILVNHTLVFPTKEMRDAFYDNFKDLIEQCKELL